MPALRLGQSANRELVTVTTESHDSLLSSFVGFEVTIVLLP
jgi:hypothetical protein